jgi:uncharacterized protein
MDNAHTRLVRLQEILRGMGSVLIAYSGGVDSTFLMKVAADALGRNVLAVTAVSPTYPQEEHDRACALARSLGVRHTSIFTDELADPTFASNPPDRCYHCKRELFRKLREIAAREGLKVIADASNTDDLSDFRPGRKAAVEAGIRSPLIEAGLNKNDIRLLSKEMGLETWDKPSAACLASRLPYGEEITPAKLQRVDAAEKLLRDLGFGQVRVRSHGDLARIEVEPDSVARLASPETRAAVTVELKKLGFTYVTLDLLGYRTGSLNEALNQPVRRE